MKTPATKFEVEVNGKRFSAATVSLEDQLEVNLGNLAGQETAVLTVTAFIHGEPRGGNYVRSENLVLTPGDRVQITLSAAEDASTDVGPPDAQLQRELSQEPETSCSFCGKRSSKWKSSSQGRTRSFATSAFSCASRLSAKRRDGRDEVIVNGRQHTPASLHGSRGNTAGVHGAGVDGAVDPLAHSERVRIDALTTDDVDYTLVVTPAPVQSIGEHNAAKRGTFLSSTKPFTAPSGRKR